MANSDIGFITRENFLKMLPERVPVRKSSKESSKFPLYCHCPMLGPVSVNTRAGQDVILENAVLFGANGPEPVQEDAGVVATVKQPDPEVFKPCETETVKPLEPEKSLGFSGFIKSLGQIDE